MKRATNKERTLLNYYKKCQGIAKQAKTLILSLYSFLAVTLDGSDRAARSLPNISRIKASNARRGRRFLLTALTAFIFTISFSGINLWWSQPAVAATTLTIEPLTWDFIGLDSNNPSVGPNQYLIGARVCNVGSETARNVSIQFIREGASNPYIQIRNSINTDTWFTSAIAPGSRPLNHHQLTAKPSNCFDAYYIATVQRTSAAQNTIQRYRIEATADNAAPVNTNNPLFDNPHPRQLYVEKILSQARNDVLLFENVTTPGSNTVYVGETYEFHLQSKTATAYPQLTISSDFPNIAFQILNVRTEYQNPVGTKNSSIYADACGWISDPTYTGYHESSSNCDYIPISDQYTGGKVGDTVDTYYKIKILSTGTGGTATTNYNINHLILDFSGGSYHYNADYGSGVGVGMTTITVVNREADISLDKSHTGSFATGDNLYSLKVTNLSTTNAAKAPITITDTLPTGFSFNPSNTSTGVESGPSAGWTCAATNQNLTCINPNDLAAGATSTVNIKVNVSTSAATNVVNTATVSSSTPDPVPGNNTDSDPTTVVKGPNIVLTKDSVPSNAVFSVGATATYRLTVSNTSGFDAAGPLTLVDTLPAGLSFNSASGTGWTCSANGQNVTCTNPSGLNNGSTSTLDLGVNVLSNVGNSVTNTATVTSGSIDTNPADNTNITKTNTTSKPIPDLSIQKTDNGLIFAQNQNGSYTITVTNNGAAATTGAITVTDTLPGNMLYKGFSGTNWTCTSNCTIETTTRTTPLTVTFTNPGPLAVAQSTSFTITVQPTVTGSLTNTVNVSTPGDGTTGTKAPSDTTTINAAGGIDLNVVKKLTLINGAAPSPACTTSGQTDTCTAALAPVNDVQYTVTITNNSGGNGSDTGITFTDNVPSGITGVTWSCTFGGTTPTALGSGSNASNNGSYNSCTGATSEGSSPYITHQRSGSGNNISINTISLRKASGNVAAGTPNPNGGKVVITINGKVASTNFSGLLSNTANVTPGSASGADSFIADNTYTVNSTVTGADLSLSKTSFGNFVVGVNGTYRLTVTNVSTTYNTTGLITVTDTLPTGLNFVSATSAPGYAGWACNYDSTSRKVTCTNNNVLNKSPGSGNVSAIDITVTPTASGSVQNNAVVSTPGDTNAANNPASVTTTITAADPDLRIVKTAGTLALGQTGTYTIQVQNIGTTVAQAPITVRDTLPAGLVFLSGTGTGWSCAATGQNVVCTNYSNLAGNNTFAPNLTLNVLVSSQTTASINNTASVDAAPSEAAGKLANNTTTITTSVAQSADLSINKTLAGNLVAGQNATYQLQVSNNGPSNATNAVTVTDNLPSGLTFQSFTANTGWTCKNASNAACTAGDTNLTFTKSTGLAVGEISTITLNVAVPSSATGTIKNTASVSTTGITDPDTSNNSKDISSSVSPRQADLVLSKTHVGNFTIGRQGTYTLTVTNDGPATAAAPITITDNLPSNLSFASFLGTSAWDCPGIKPGDTNVTCTYSNSLAAGESNAIDITVSVGSGTPTGPNRITNSATVSSNTPDSDPANNTKTDPTTVVSGADLTISKTHTGTFAAPATGVKYTLTVTNNGPNTADASSTTPIRAIDYLPVGVKYVSASSANFTCTSDGAASGNTVTCTRTTPMTSGDSSTIELTVDVLNTATSPLENNAVVGGGLTPDPNQSNNLATDTVSFSTASGRAKLLLVKRITAVNRNGEKITNYNGQPLDKFNDDGTPNNEDNNSFWPTPNTYLRGAVNGGTVMPGDEIEYTIYFLSSGDNAAKNVTLCDRVPSNTTFIDDAFNGLTPTGGGTPGEDSGIALAHSSASLPTQPTTYLTNIADADKGQFFFAGDTPPIDCSGSNTNGAVVVKVVTGETTLPKAISAGNPANSYGFIRFRARVN